MKTRHIALIIILSVILVIYFKPNMFTKQINKKSEIPNVIFSVHETSEMNNKLKEPRVFCLIKSHLKSYRTNQVQSMYKIWINKCDDYRIIMIIPEEFRTNDWKLGEEFEINTPLRIIQPKTLEKETHRNLTLKIYHALIYVHKKLPDFAWYYVVDDDSYVNVDNLRKFLATKDPNAFITFGYNFNVIPIFMIFYSEILC